MKQDDQIAIVGLFADHESLVAAYEGLRKDGFHESDISVLVPERAQTAAAPHDPHTKAPEGALAGAGVGGAVGTTLGLLAGLGALAIPGFGPILAAGPIVAALAGAGVVGAVGSLTGALVGLGIPESDAKHYADVLQRGGALLSVRADDEAWARRARIRFDRFGAELPRGLQQAS